MKIANFNFEQYVDQNIFNNAMTTLLTSMREMGNDNVFFIPGIVNPASIAYTFNNNLTVNLTFTNTGLTPFRTLFQTGQYCSPHGTTTGVDTNAYLADFTAFVPSTGTTTAYLVAQAAEVSGSATTIIGPPVGHPDFSPNFVPYTGYTIVQDTISLLVTTTVPDNLSNLEIARIVLTPGQTSISALDTSHQVLARVNTQFVTLNGDVTGNSQSNTIFSWQGNPIALTTPHINSVPLWNGTSWNPVTLSTSFPPRGAAGGDLGGNYPNPTVNQSSASTFLVLGSEQVNGSLTVSGNENVTGLIAAGGTISSSSTVTGGNVTSNTTILANTDVTALGHLIGANNATAPSHATLLGQFLSSIASNGYVIIPTWNGSGPFNLYIQWGTVIYNQSIGTGDKDVTNSWNIAFPNQFLVAVGTALRNFGVDPHDWGLEFVNNNPGVNYLTTGAWNLDNFAGNNVTPYGWTWVAIGF